MRAIGASGNIKMARHLIIFLGNSKGNICQNAINGIKYLIVVNRIQMAQILLAYGIKNKNPEIAKKVNKTWKEMKLPEISAR